MALFKNNPKHIYGLCININAKSHNDYEKAIILQSQALWLIW